MTNMNAMPITERKQNLTHWLNQQAYLQSKDKKHFTPCEKTKFILESELPFEFLLDEAKNVPCHCHNYISAGDMFDYSFDSRARLAHENHEAFAA